MVRALTLSCALLAGCGACVPFADVEIVGGSAAAREVVAGALADFAGWTGRAEICVERVELTDEVEAADPDTFALGRYDRGRNVISLLAEQPFLYDVAVHELCHAVDLRDDVSRRFPDLFDLAPGFSVAGRRTERTEGYEALAFDCEVGPELLAVGRAAARTCGPPDVVETFDVLLTEIYVDADEVPVVPIERRPVADLVLPEGFEPQAPVGGTTADQLLVVGELGGEASLLAVDPYTGDLVGPAGQVVVAPVPEAKPARIFAAAAAELGAETVVPMHWTVASGAVLRFLAVWDGARWGLAERPCIGPNTWAVGLEEPWLVEISDRTVSWSVLDG